MATKLSDLASQAMAVGANTGVSSYIYTWLNWAIQEIWEDSLWEFRVKESATPLSLVAGDFQKGLASDFSKPKDFRITTSGYERKLYPLDKEKLVLAAPNWKDTASDKRGTPRIWVKPILYTTAAGIVTKTVQFWPPADIPYVIDYDYYPEHPILGSSDFCMIPSRHDRVIINRVLVYIRANEDEADLSSWEKRYIESLKHMRSIEKRHPGELPGWTSEIALLNVQRALLGSSNDQDIR